MGKKIGRNQPCPCGSKIKHKKCCMNTRSQTHPDPFVSLFQKITKNELPLFAEISSKDGNCGSMEIQDARIIRNGVETVLLSDKVSLSVNDTSGDKTSESSARIEIYPGKESDSTIKLEGNAAIKNSDERLGIRLADDKKKMKASSENGLFASVWIGHQRDQDFDFFNLVFGKKGEADTRDVDGQKRRPHIAFYPCGNGKFVRVREFGCAIHGVLKYDALHKTITPSHVRIEIKNYEELLLLDFTFDQSDSTVILTNVKFTREERTSHCSTIANPTLAEQ